MPQQFEGVAPLLPAALPLEDDGSLLPGGQNEEGIRPGKRHSSPLMTGQGALEQEGEGPMEIVLEGLRDLAVEGLVVVNSFHSEILPVPGCSQRPADPLPASCMIDSTAELMLEADQRGGRDGRPD